VSSSVEPPPADARRRRRVPLRSFASGLMELPGKESPGRYVGGGGRGGFRGNDKE